MEHFYELMQEMDQFADPCPYLINPDLMVGLATP